MWQSGVFHLVSGAEFERNADKLEGNHGGVVRMLRARRLCQKEKVRIPGVGSARSRDVRGERGRVPGVCEARL